MGKPGTGKTIFGMHFLREGSKAGEKCLYISLAENTDFIKINMGNFGWDLDSIEFVDLSSMGLSGLSGYEYQVFHPSEVEQPSQWKEIYQIIEDRKPDRLVIDPMTQLLSLAASEYQFRKQVLNLIILLAKKGCTSLLTFEPTELEREHSLSLLVDGVIQLMSEVTPGRLIGIRSIKVEKFRGSGFISGLHPFRITDHGIEIFPHLIESPGEAQPGGEMLPSGIPELDEIIGGGLESGTTTVISGPSGTGKTSLGLQFLLGCTSKGKRASLFSFEESIASMIVRARGMQMPLEQFIQDKRIIPVFINPMERYPDEFLSLVRTQVEKDGISCIMIDSLRGYQLAMEQFGMLDAHLYNLTNYLNRKGIISVLINELEMITEHPRLTGSGISYLPDNIITLRYLELAGIIQRTIACYKKRLGAFKPELRKFSLTSSGIKVGEKVYYIHNQGFITRPPTSSKE